MATVSSSAAGDPLAEKGRRAEEDESSADHLTSEKRNEDERAVL